MSISDFIVVLSIIITLVTVVISNNKHLWLYKFDWKITIFLIAIVLFIHYLIFFDKCFYSWGLYFDFFMCKNGIDANIWAYIITVVSLLILILYVGRFPYFPKTNNNKIIRYYESLINTDIVRLMKDIDNYHKKDIDNYFKRINKLSEENSKKDIITLALKEKKYANKKQKNNLPRDIVSNIIFNRNFIKKSLEIEPIYFLARIKEMNLNNLIDSDRAVDFYFTLLINSKNEIFIQEIEDSLNDGKIDYTDKEFLSLILKKEGKFIHSFSIDKIFGEAAYKEICVGNIVFTQRTNEWRDVDYKRTACFQFLEFFKIFHTFLIDNCISRDDNAKNFYAEYIHFLTDRMITTYFNINSNEKTYAKRFIEDSISTIEFLLERCYRKDNPTNIDVYAQVLLNISKASKTYKTYNKDAVKNLLDNYINLYKLNNDKCSLTYFEYIKDNKEKINDIAKEILDQMSEEVKNNKAYQQLTELFNN